MFFLDYDGTLTPIVERPEDAIMSSRTREVIRRLAMDHTVAMISGRDVSFVQDQVGVDGVVYAGSHGFDIVGPVSLEGDTLTEFQLFLPPLDDAEASLRARLAGVDGANVERKKYSVAAHYRQVAPEDVHLVTEAVDDVLASQSALRKGLGKKVYEIRPDIDWHKGRAVTWLFGALGFDERRAVPFYLGDDVTDEDAFAALHGVGIGIIVGEGEGESAASYSIRDTEAVTAFLDAMCSHD